MKKVICDNFKLARCFVCGKHIINDKGNVVRISACAENVKHIACK